MMRTDRVKWDRIELKKRQQTPYADAGRQYCASKTCGEVYSNRSQSVGQSASSPLGREAQAE